MYVRGSFCTRTNSTIIHFTNNTFLRIFTTNKKTAQTLRVISNVFRIYNLDCEAIILIVSLWMHQMQQTQIHSFYYHKCCNCAFKMLSQSFQAKNQTKIPDLCIPLSHFIRVIQKIFTKSEVICVRSNIRIRNEIQTNVLLCVIKKEALNDAATKCQYENEFDAGRKMSVLAHLQSAVRCAGFFSFPQRLFNETFF